MKTPRNPDPDGKGPGIARFRGLFAARFSLLGGRFRGLLRGRFRAGGNPLLILFAHPVELFHQLSCAAFVLRQVQHQADQAEVRLVEAFDDQGRLVYEGSYTPSHNGHYLYGVRVLPWCEGLDNPLATGMVQWG